MRAYKRVRVYDYVYMYANLCVCKGSQAGQGTMLPFLQACATLVLSKVGTD